MGNVTVLFSDVNTMWVLIATALVFFMQAGFAMVETGFTRAKNSGNIIMKVLVDFSVGAPLYWLAGFGIMFGGQGAIIGGLNLFGMGEMAIPAGVDKFAYFIFQTAFCAAAATIVSGAMAERTKFSSYCIFSAIMSVLIYPISGHWVWGGGWLAQLGFHDFAGSTAVHLVGGIAALVGAAIVGPRIGKYDKNGKSRAIPGHSIPLGALGVFILWFCWFGFNGGSTVSMTGGGAALVSKVFFNTNLSAATATLTTLLFTWALYKKPDVSMTLNGSLAGLVAVTAGCDVINPWAAAVIGVCSGIAVVIGIEGVDKVLKIDDPVGAVGVHCVNGALGTLLTGLLISNASLAKTGMSRIHFFGIQALGVGTVALYAAIASGIVFLILKHTIGIRVSREDEIGGLDLSEHGLVNAYADFAPDISDFTMDEYVNVELPKNAVPIDDAVPIMLKSKPKNNYASDVKLTKIDILIKQERLEMLKNALMDIGITGMTVTHVLGCGTQKGKPEYYRGALMEVNLLPKVQVEIVVCQVPVKTVIETAKKVLYTGHIGDGKIFVYDVENVIKVRTGEEGCEALKNVE